MNSTKRPTMMDVARLAGVSHQTVSRYLTRSGGLKPDTRERIDVAIRELDYRPNLVARSMRTRISGRLIILMPRSTYSPNRILSAATAVAREAGYATDVMSLDGDADGRTARMLELADSGQYEGILSFTPLSLTPETRMPADTTVVVSADYDDAMRGIGELADGSPVAELIEGLAARGHRRFLHVAGSQTFASARARKQVYLDTVEQLGLESEGVVDGNWTPESGIAAMAGLRDDSGVTAVIAANDLVAGGVIRGARDRGWRVPDDLVVTGWDNNPLGALLDPSLTTVDIDLEGLGRAAMGRLIAGVTGATGAPGDTESRTETLNTVLWRESTARRSP